jgi:hypothetical protein
MLNVRLIRIYKGKCPVKLPLDQNGERHQVFQLMLSPCCYYLSPV